MGLEARRTRFVLPVFVLVTMCNRHPVESLADLREWSLICAPVPVHGLQILPPCGEEREQDFGEYVVRSALEPWLCWRIANLNRIWKDKYNPDSIKAKRHMS